MKENGTSATEQRLIDANKAQAVLVNMAEHLMEAGNPKMAGAVGYAAEVIGKQRTVDAVEVVRCKNCEFWNEPWLVGVINGKCRLGKTMITEPGHYCSYGKRRIE